MKLNLPKLKERCLQDFEDFAELGEVWESAWGRHIFIDRESNVLAVAHLDTHGKSHHFAPVRLANKLMVFAEQLDDRLGAHIILDHLPKLGLEYDVLLTEGEESCMSTAADFEAPRQYNWVFEFDRAGSDVVLYQYQDEATGALLQEFGFEIGRGTFSDITFLDDLKCKCFNFGTGYYNQHTELSYMLVAETRRMIDQFCLFWDAYKDVPLPHIEAPRYGWATEGYYHLTKGDNYLCLGCGEQVNADEYWFDDGLCVECRRESQYTQALRQNELAEGLLLTGG